MKVQSFEGHFAAVSSVVFSPNSKQVVSSAADNTVRVWSIDSGECEATLNPRKRQYSTSIHTVAFVRADTSGNHLLVAASTDNLIHLWDATTLQRHCKGLGNNKRAWNPSVTSHGASKSISFQNNGSGLFAAGSLDGYVRIYTAKTGKCVKMLQGGAYIVLFSPDQRYLATVSHDTIYLWDASSYTLIRTLKSKHYDMISSLVFSHGTNSKFLISISGDGNVCLIWNVETGAHEIATSSATSCIAASPDGKHFACATSQTLTLLAIKTKRVVKTLRAVSRIMAIAFSHDGAAIACGTERGTVQVWHLLDRVLIYNVGLALMQVELAPYVALDVIDFLLADGNNLCESFETHAASYHMEKISTINALQRHVKKFAMQL